MIFEKLFLNLMLFIIFYSYLSMDEILLVENYNLLVYLCKSIYLIRKHFNHLYNIVPIKCVITNIYCSVINVLFPIVLGCKQICCVCILRKI